MVEGFTMRRCWATRLLWPLVRGEVAAEVGDGRVRIRLGVLGRADVDVTAAARLSRMNWPWWGGIGARLGKNLVASTTAWGEAALVDLVEPVEVRAPMRWRTGRLVLSVEDVEGFIEAVARERAAAS